MHGEVNNNALDYKNISKIKSYAQLYFLSQGYSHRMSVSG